MLGKNRHSHVVDKCDVGCCKAKGYGKLIQNLYLLHVLKVGGVFRAVFRIHYRFDGEFYVICAEGFAVMPFYSFDKVEGVGIACRVIIPAFGKAGNHFVFSVVRGKAVKEQNVYFAVLVHCRVDPCIISAAVDKGFVVSLLCCFSAAA